jgi:hypothetical protein
MNNEDEKDEEVNYKEKNNGDEKVEEGNNKIIEKRVIIETCPIRNPYTEMIRFHVRKKRIKYTGICITYYV